MRGRRQDRPSGFLGVRGKKSSNYPDSYENEWYAAYNDNDLSNNFYDEYLDEQEKRKPQGFVGLRGKKSDEETPDFVIAKRVPVTSFFGIGLRGKKEPSSFNVSLCDIVEEKNTQFLMSILCSLPSESLGLFQIAFKVLRCEKEAIKLEFIHEVCGCEGQKGMQLRSKMFVKIWIS